MMQQYPSLRKQSLENGHAPIRSDTSIRVYTTAEPIRVLRALVSDPLVLLDKAGRLENAAYTQWVAHTYH